MTEPRILRGAKQIAFVVGLSEKWTSAMLTAGRIAPAFKVGGIWYCRQTELEFWRDHYRTVGANWVPLYRAARRVLDSAAAVDGDQENALVRAAQLAALDTAVAEIDARRAAA